jgi:elongation factor G
MAQRQWILDQIRNFGISAHIDSGKTTLSERILFYTGKIHTIREVRGKDGVGATMDSMDLEREKGITIQSAATFGTWKDISFNLIDTPGHVDFTVEVERSLRVLDGAILVLCGVAGVQSQSITVDRQMKRYSVPRLAFVNKLDRAGANPFRVMQGLREKLRLNAVMVQIPVGIEDSLAGVVDLITMKAFLNEGENGENIIETEIPADLQAQAQEYRDELIAKLADVDDAIAEKYLMEEVPTNDEIKAAIRKATIALKFVPVFCGSAFKNRGVQKLLDGIADYLPNPAEKENVGLDIDNNEQRVVLATDPAKPLVAYAFKLDDGRYGQLTYMRVYQGTMRKGDFITNITNQKKVKIPRMVRMHASEMVDIQEASAGDIVALFGVDCASGDTFTDSTVNIAMTSMFVPEPVISLAVAPKSKDAGTNFAKALQKFRKEDPTFRVSRDEESNEMIISGMGELHLEIYIERMKREFGCEVIAGKPQVAYRETISRVTDFDYTHKKQTGGSGQFAKILGTIEPTEPGEDGERKTYEFVDEVVGGRIPKEFVPAVDDGFQEQMVKGPLIGFPIMNLKVTLKDGQSHDVDSSYMAFKIAGMAALRDVYMKAGPVALEPIMKLEVNAPEEYQGAVMGGINQRRGMIQGSQNAEGNTTIEAEVPLTEMFGYSTDLRSSTQGKGEFTMEFSRYAPVPRNVQDDLHKAYLEKRAQESKA